MHNEFNFPFTVSLGRGQRAEITVYAWQSDCAPFVEVYGARQESTGRVFKMEELARQNTALLKAAVKIAKLTPAQKTAAFIRPCPVQLHAVPARP